jgi:uncharacterized membrane protein YeaQ/YmgE (transglycosylase-associated protein family)
MDAPSIGVLAATESGLMGLLIALAIGGLIGWVASLVMKTDGQMGLLANVIVGVVGSALGHFLAGVLGLAAMGQPGRLLVSIGGAVVLIAILRALRVMR